MERQGMKWQIVLGALLLAVLIGSMFLPVFKVTGERYISAAMKANSYAEEEDLDAAKKAGTKKITDKYQKNTTSRKKKVKEFDKEIDQKSDRISGIHFIRWAFSSGKKYDFPGAVYVDKKDIKKSGVTTVFRMMAILLLLPILVAMGNMIFMLVRRKTYPIWLAVSGLAELLCQGIFWGVMPGMIWDKISAYIKCFTLIGEKTLLIKGTGKCAVQSMMLEFMSSEIYVGVGAAGVLLLFSILFMTACRPARMAQDSWEKGGFQEGEWNVGGQVSDLSVQWDDFMGSDQALKNSGGQMAAAEDFLTEYVKPAGVLRGIQGQYKDCDVEIGDGEEIVLGRDPKYCGLVFSNKKVSRRHCGIRYDGDSGKYQVIDYSSNGTTFADGRIAKAGVYTAVSSGTVLNIAGGAEKIQLGRGKKGNAAGGNL